MLAKESTAIWSYARIVLKLSCVIKKNLFYRVAKGGMLDYFENSLSDNMSHKSSGLPKTIKRERERTGADTETVDLILA